MKWLCAAHFGKWIRPSGYIPCTPYICILFIIHIIWTFWTFRLYFVSNTFLTQIPKKILEYKLNKIRKKCGKHSISVVLETSVNSQRKLWEAVTVYPSSYCRVSEQERAVDRSADLVDTLCQRCCISLALLSAHLSFNWPVRSVWSRHWHHRGNVRVTSVLYFF